MEQVSPVLELNEQGWMVLAGDLSFDTVRELSDLGRNHIDELSTIKVDLKGVVPVDSSALAILTDWYRHAKQLNKTIEYYHAPQPLLDLCHVCEIDSVLPLINEVK